MIPNVKRIALIVILTSGTLTVMTGSIIAPAVNLMRDAFGVGASAVGLVIITHSLFLAVSSPLTGSIIDRKGLKTPIVAGLLVYGIAGGAGVCIDNFYLLLASRALMGIALASFFAATSTLILDLYEDTQRVRIMGWYSSAQSLGGIVWPMVGGALGAVSWHLPFAVYLVAVPIGIAAAAGIPNSIERTREVSSAADTTVFRIFRETPVLFIVCSLMFYANFHLYTVIIFLPQLLETYGISNAFKLSVFIALITVASGTVGLFYWRIRARLSYRAMAAAGVLIDGGAFALIFASSHIPVIASAVVLFGIGMAFIYPTCFLWIGDLVPPNFRGRFNSYLLMTAFVAQFAVPILLAPVAAASGLRAVFFTGICSSLLWLAMLFLFRRRMSVRV